MANGDTDATRTRKSSKAFRTISEVSTELDIPAHVLRFWESKFVQIKPLKRGGGRRYYRPEDINLLRGIRELLYTDGYTIKGVQKLLREGGAKVIVAVSEKSPVEVGHAVEAPPRSLPEARRAHDFDDSKKAELASVLDEMKSLRDILKNAVV